MSSLFTIKNASLLSQVLPLNLYSSDAIRYSEKVARGETTLQISMDEFLKQVEKKAFRMADIATKNQADALDIVQETMIKLVEKYSDRPSNEWKPLFYRILHSKIMDHFRRQKVYRGIFFWKNHHQQEDSLEDSITNASDHITPEREISAEQNILTVINALKLLSPRQQQCFLLRSWEGMSVAETASIMECAEGSVKTHYSRAKEALRLSLSE